MDGEELERRRIMAVLEESDSDVLPSDQESEEDDDHVSERSEASNTEQEISDDDEVPLATIRRRVQSEQNLQQEEYASTSLSTRDCEYTRQYFGKDGTAWFRKPLRQNVRTRAENIIDQLPGVAPEAKAALSEFASWNLFFTDEMLQLILNYTNERIRPKIALCNNLSKYTHIKECSMAELKALFGLLYLAGLNRSGRQNLSDLWSTDGTGVEIYRLVMSKQRFYFLQSCLTFDNLSTREERRQFDNLAPIRELFEAFVENCKKSYVPSDCLTIDEMLIAFRGRCKFRQYIPSKPAKYGLKIFALVDARNFYIKNLEIYPGKQPDGPYSSSNKPFDIVDRIVQPISKTNRNVTFDNWFTSYELVQHLLSEHKLTSVGTLRKNKRQIPPEFTKSRKGVFTSQFAFQKDITLVSHTPKKNKIVLLMSSLHHDDSIDSSTGEKKKPEINTYYNITKCGVDVADELCASYDVCRNSKKWPLTIFYAILNMSAINGLIIHRINNESNIKRRRYLKNLGLALVIEHLKVRGNVQSLPRELRKKIIQFTGESTEEPPAKKTNARKRCQVCPASKDRKTTHVCEGCNKHICPQHIVPFCANCIDKNESE